MAHPPGDAGQLDADRAGRREFTRARKGYDPVEVRAHLLTLSGEVARLQAVEADLVRQVEQLQTSVDAHQALDPGAVTRALGDETVRVIDAAREAANEIRSKAEQNASRLVADAHERANRLTQEAADLREAAAAAAEELGAESRRQAEELIAESEAIAQATRDDAQADADRWRAEASELLELRTTEAEAAAAQIRHDAVVDAEQRLAEAVEAAAAEVETAREQGRDMITEAREARERILRDLAERRQVARRQLEALRAGRERLLASFAAARTALDDATDEVVDGLPAARDAADQAARSLEHDLDAAIDELDREASSDGVGRLDAGRDLDDQAPDDDVIGDDTARNRSSLPLDESTSDDDVASGTDAVVTVGEPAVQLADVAPEPDAELEPAPDPSSADDPTSSHLRLVANETGEASGAQADAGAIDPADATDSVDDAEPESGSMASAEGDHPAPVEEIFARLRAAKSAPAALDDDLDDDDEDDDEDDDDLDDDLDDDDDEDAPGQVATVTAIGEAATEGFGDDATGGEDLAGAEELETQVVLDVRDDVAGESDRLIARRLKRVTADHENAVLDRVRRQRKSVSVDDLLGTADEMSGSFVGSLSAELMEALESGRIFVDRRVGTSAVSDVKTVLSELSPLVVEWVSDPLRARLGRIIEESDDQTQERAELAERLRSAYREWRNDKLSELAGDLATLAFNSGVRHALPAGASVCWLVDHGGLPCPDAEDNHLAGALEVGTAFPTGDLAPPAHPGCRCVLSPQRR